MINSKLLLASVAILGSSAAMAFPTSLTLMPIADVIKHRDAFVSHYSFGVRNGNKWRYSHLASAQVGLFNRAEIGLDHDYDGRGYLNFKVSLLDGTQKEAPGVAVSAGLVNIRGKNSDPFVVGRYNLKDARIHAGWWRTTGASRAMAGVDFTVLKNVTIMLEHLSGKEGISWAAFSLPVKSVPGMTVGAGVGVPNLKHGGVQHNVNAFYNFKL